MKVLLAVLVTIVCLFAIGFGIDMLMLKERSVTSPIAEQIRNDTFHSSQAYTDGMKSELAKLHYAFASTKDHDAQSSICALVRSDFGSVDPRDLSIDLRSFLVTCENWH